MNKPEKITMALDKSVYDDLQTKITSHQRQLECALLCCMKESAGMEKTNPELFAMIRLATENAGILHYNLGALQKQVFADGGLTKPHAASILPWFAPDGTLTTTLIAPEAGGCK